MTIALRARRAKRLVDERQMVFQEMLNAPPHTPERDCKFAQWKKLTHSIDAAWLDEESEISA